MASYDVAINIGQASPIGRMRLDPELYILNPTP
jgi:hypothetical protein